MLTASSLLRYSLHFFNRASLSSSEREFVIPQGIITTCNGTGHAFYAAKKLAHSYKKLETNIAALCSSNFLYAHRNEGYISLFILMAQIILLQMDELSKGTGPQVS